MGLLLGQLEQSAVSDKGSESVHAEDAGNLRQEAHLFIGNPFAPPESDDGDAWEQPRHKVQPGLWRVHFGAQVTRGPTQIEDADLSELACKIRENLAAVRVEGGWPGLREQSGSRRVERQRHAGHKTPDFAPGARDSRDYCEQGVGVKPQEHLRQHVVRQRELHRGNINILGSRRSLAVGECFLRIRSVILSVVSSGLVHGVADGRDLGRRLARAHPPNMPHRPRFKVLLRHGVQIDLVGKIPRLELPWHASGRIALLLLPLLLEFLRPGCIIALPPKILVVHRVAQIVLPSGGFRRHAP
eukprot:m.57731 g.57731  ORF g.57731 m.57731 type:complete len:300 (+) comp9370_c0_seq2:3291-4190(+)